MSTSSAFCSMADASEVDDLPPSPVVKPRLPEADESTRNLGRTAIASVLSASAGISALAAKALSVALEAALYKMNPQSTYYRDDLRRMMMTLQRQPRIRRGLTDGTLSAGRLVKAMEDDLVGERQGIPSLLEALSDADDLGRWLDLGDLGSLPPEPALTLLLMLPAVDALRLGATCSQARSIVGTPLLWRLLTKRDFGQAPLRPQVDSTVTMSDDTEQSSKRRRVGEVEVQAVPSADGSLPMFAGVASGKPAPPPGEPVSAAPSVPEPAVSTGFQSTDEMDASSLQAALDVVDCVHCEPRRACWRHRHPVDVRGSGGGSSTGSGASASPAASAAAVAAPSPSRRAAPDAPAPPAFRRRPGESWLQLYQRLDGERSAMARRLAGGGPSALCHVCGRFAAEVRYSQRGSFAVTKFTACMLCGGMHVLERSTGDLPLMAGPYVSSTG